MRKYVSLQLLLLASLVDFALPVGGAGGGQPCARTYNADSRAGSQTTRQGRAS
jgi:hypothetical protein